MAESTFTLCENEEILFLLTRDTAVNNFHRDYVTPNLTQGFNALEVESMDWERVSAGEKLCAQR